MSTEEVKENLKSQVKEQVDHFKDETEHLKSRARDGYSHFKERMAPYEESAHETIEQVSSYVQEHPRRSSIIAALGGVMLGMILGLLMRGGRD